MPMKLVSVLTASLVLCLVDVGASWAQQSDLESQLRRAPTTRFGNTSTFRMNPIDVHPKGDYGGVQPGVSTPKSWSKRRPLRNKARRKNIVRWIGFQPKNDGRSRVFVQLTGPVEFTQSMDGNVLLVTLQGARLGGSNARRPLDTRFFDTITRRVVAKRVRRQVVLRVTFKNPADAATATANLETSKTDGYSYLFLDFGAPSGEALKAEAEDDESASDDDDDDDDE